MVTGRLKFIASFVGLMLIILAASTTYISAKELLGILPAESYEDKGVYTFKPNKLLPVQVKNTSSSGRDRRLYPTKTIYKVYYKSVNNSGYEWSKETRVKSEGEDILNAGIPVDRRVLSIKGESKYITVKPQDSAKSYTEKMQQKYMLILAISLVYITVYITLVGVSSIRKRKTAA